MINYPSFYEFTQAIKKMFAFYGFVTCPLSYTALNTLWYTDVDEDTIYRIGCDVAAGYTFNEALKANQLLGETE